MEYFSRVTVNETLIFYLCNNHEKNKTGEYIPLIDILSAVFSKFLLENFQREGCD